MDVPAALRDAASRVELLIGNTEDDAAPFVAVYPRIATLRRFGFVGRALVSRIVARATQSTFGIDDIVKLWRQGHGKVATYRFH